MDVAFSVYVLGARVVVMSGFKIIRKNGGYGTGIPAEDSSP
jgi:hypothetical protein